MDSALATTLRQGFASPWALTHARPWAECASDAERLDVFNGFLLSANLDALFDDFLISFTDEGALLMAAQVGSSEREKLGLDDSMRLRWVAQRHLPYLLFHRERFLQSNVGDGV